MTKDSAQPFFFLFFLLQISFKLFFKNGIYSKSERIFLLTGVVGHGRPGDVHGVEGDDGGLEETGAGLSLLCKTGQRTK